MDTTQQETESRLAYMPISFFSIVMGLSGLTIAWHKAQPVFGMNLGLINIILPTLVSAIFLVLAWSYTQKIIRFPEKVAGELKHPVKLSFFPTISISILLLSIVFLSISPAIGRVLWAVGATAHIGFVLYIISTWMHQGHFQVQHINPAWFIPAVGNVIVPIAGVPLGFVELSWFFFSIGILFWIILMTIVFYRLLFHDPIPTHMLPTLFILIAPPAVGFVSYMRLTGELDSFARILYFSGLFLTLLLFSQAKRFLRLPFFLSWWAYSFPVAAITIASMVVFEHTQKTGFMWIGGLLLTLLTCLIGLLLVRTAIAIKNREICTDAH
ncbi:MAG: C4-dicarboxylate ABC transporter [Proteobacteria bacterium]|nr:MAG: C4-dicarboxylate ABC transporter [Pseudomonadota bacterium]